MADRPPPHETREPHATRTTSGSGGKTGLAFIVGGLVVAVAIIAYVLFGGDDVDDVDINQGTVEGAAEDAGAAVEGAAEETGAAIEGAADEAGDAVEGAADAVEDAADPADTQTGD